MRGRHIPADITRRFQRRRGRFWQIFFRSCRCLLPEMLLPVLPCSPHFLLRLVAIVGQGAYRSFETLDTVAAALLGSLDAWAIWLENASEQLPWSSHLL